MNAWYQMRGKTYQCQISNAGGWFIGVRFSKFHDFSMTFDDFSKFHDFPWLLQKILFFQVFLTQWEPCSARFMGPTWGPPGAPCWPHEPCYLGTWSNKHYVAILHFKKSSKKIDTDIMKVHINNFLSTLCWQECCGTVDWCEVNRHSSVVVILVRLPDHRAQWQMAVERVTH